MALQLNNGHILPHGCNTIGGFGMDLFHSSWLLGHPRWDPGHYSYTPLIRQGHMFLLVFLLVLSRGGLHALGYHCDCIVAIVDHPNAAQSFIVTLIQLYRLSLLISTILLIICQVYYSVHEQTACSLSVFR